MALRDEAVTLVASVVAREALSLADIPGQRRALAALAGFLNEVQQVAMDVEFYVWMTQNNERVRGTHANRMNAIERWDAPPEGGHPTQDFGCRCYALPLSIDSYWERVSESVEGFTADVGDWEGNVEHMYLDDVGNVTVGKGKLLPDPTVAEVMPFRYRSSDELASPEAIRDEYQVVASQQPSQQHGAAFYEQFTQLYLAQKDIDALVQSYVRENFERMLDQYPRFGNFPYPAQVALWDMIYNLGAGGLREYQNMRRAILDDAWERAAAESGRGGISPSRNQYVFDLFMSAEHLDD